MPVGFGYRLLNSDGDLARHLRLGEIMLQRHGLVRDGHVLVHQGRRAVPRVRVRQRADLRRGLPAAGLAGVAVLAGLVLALTYALVARFLIRRGGDPLLAYLVSMAAAVLSAAHWLARPHLFTMLFVVVLLELLQHTTRRALLAYVPLFALWANLHGGFSFGCILIALYAAGELVRVGSVRTARPGSPARPPPCGGARPGTGEQPAQPAWVKLLAHVFGFFGNSAILRQTQEFMSPDFHTINGKIFLLALLSVIAALAWSRRRPTGPGAARPARPPSPSRCSRSGTSSCSP